jgi:hypothetical protein
MGRIRKVLPATFGGIAVVCISFWITLRFLQNWTPGIHIVEAAYGGNCKDYKVPPPQENKFSSGNATSVVAHAPASATAAISPSGLINSAVILFPSAPKTSW